jgi:hypothetical protein
MVWHHRRASIRAYWKQQCGYGKAEALLERKWPEQYNLLGHHTWTGRIYAAGGLPVLGRAGRIYHGIWGNAPVQFRDHTTPGVLGSFLLMPEWYLVIVALAGLAVLGLQWRPLLLALPLLALAAGVLILQAVQGAAHASRTSPVQSRVTRLKVRTLTALLYVLHPLARLNGRLHAGLTPWRQYGTSCFALPWARTALLWGERWRDPDAWLQTMEDAFRRAGVRVLRGGVYERWDFEVHTSVWAAARMAMAFERHAGGSQLIRFRVWPRCSPTALILALLSTTLAVTAGREQAWLAAALLGLVAGMLVLRTFQDCASATATVWRILTQPAATHKLVQRQPRAAVGEVLLGRRSRGYEAQDGRG